MSGEFLRLLLIIKFLLKLRFPFFDGGEAGFEIVGERFGELVFGNADGFRDVERPVARNVAVQAVHREVGDGGGGEERQEEAVGHDKVAASSNANSGSEVVGVCCGAIHDFA